MLIVNFWNLTWNKKSKKFMIFKPTKTTLVHSLIKANLLKRRRGLIFRAHATKKRETTHTNYSSGTKCMLVDFLSQDSLFQMINIFNFTIYQERKHNNRLCYNAQCMPRTEVTEPFLVDNLRKQSHTNKHCQDPRKSKITKGS